MSTASKFDTNYIFLTFVTRYLPAGMVGLVLAMILGATMSSIASEMNALATVSIIDIYVEYKAGQSANPGRLGAGRNVGRAPHRARFANDSQGAAHAGGTGGRGPAGVRAGRLLRGPGC